MGAHHPAALIQKIPGGVVLAGKLLHKAGIVAIRHKADILTVRLAGNYQTVFFGNSPDLLLGIVPQRKPQQLQLRLGQVV